MSLLTAVTGVLIVGPGSRWIMNQKIVRSGVWYYDDRAPITVHIVEHDYDPIYEFFQGRG